VGTWTVIIADILSLRGLSRVILSSLTVRIAISVTFCVATVIDYSEKNQYVGVSHDMLNHCYNGKTHHSRCTVISNDDDHDEINARGFHSVLASFLCQ